MKNNQLIAYGIGAIILAIILQNTWQWIVGGLAIMGAFHVMNDINRNNRR